MSFLDRRRQRGLDRVRGAVGAAHRAASRAERSFTRPRKQADEPSAGVRARRARRAVFARRSARSRFVAAGGRAPDVIDRLAATGRGRRRGGSTMTDGGRRSTRSRRACRPTRAPRPGRDPHAQVRARSAPRGLYKGRRSAADRDYGLTRPRAADGFVAWLAGAPCFYRFGGRRRRVVRRRRPAARGRAAPGVNASAAAAGSLVAAHGRAALEGAGDDCDRSRARRDAFASRHGGDDASSARDILERRGGAARPRAPRSRVGRRRRRSTCLAAPRPRDARRGCGGSSRAPRAHRDRTPYFGLGPVNGRDVATDDDGTSRGRSPRGRLLRRQNGAWRGGVAKRRLAAPTGGRAQVNVPPPHDRGLGALTRRI